MRNFLFLFLMLLCFGSVAAQDTLFKRNREIMIVKITEVGLDEVKYKFPGDESSPVITIAKDQLQKVVFSNGLTQIMTPDMTNPENYAGQKRNALKLDFVSPLRNNLSFVYERSIRPGRSIEFNLGIVGVGVGTVDWDPASGAFFRVGYKFMKTPDFYLRGMRYSHILKGGYVRPDFILGSYSVNRVVDNSYWNPLPPYNWISNQSTSRLKSTYGALHLSIGKQWIYDDAFLVDIFGGVGYAVSSTTGVNKDAYRTVEYGIVGGGSETPLSFSGGVRIGFLFK